jgi:hypothetical protein
MSISNRLTNLATEVDTVIDDSIEVFDRMEYTLGSIRGDVEERLGAR